MTLNLRESLNFILKPALLLAGCLCMACSSGDKHVDDPDGPDNPGGGDEYEDIQVVNGKVRFYLREAENSVRKAMGTGERAWSKSLVSVNGKSYAVESDENGRYYVEASASSSGTYNAILTNSGSSGWYGSSAYADVKLPYSQFWAATAASLQSYPMYGSYTKENGNKLVFDDAFAVLDWGRGVWTYHNTWYWASASGTLGGVPFGFNLGYGFGDTSAATENALFHGGRLHKLTDVDFGIPQRDGKPDFLSPWHFTSSDGRFTAEFRPILDRAACTDFQLLKSDQHQVFGRFTGECVLDDGTALSFRDFPGFAEQVENKW